MNNSQPVQLRAQAELKPEEKLLWADSPLVGRMSFHAFGIYVFAIPWTAFSVFWESIVLSPLWMQVLPESWQPANIPEMPDGFGWGSLVMGIFGLPFILIGFAMLLSPFFIGSEAKNTVYALTNKRAFILNHGFGRRTVKSFSLDQIGNETEVQERKDGSGTLYFSIRRYKDSDGDSRTEKEGFKHVKNVRQAERLLFEAQKNFKRYG